MLCNVLWKVLCKVLCKVYSDVRERIQKLSKGRRPGKIFDNLPCKSVYFTHFWRNILFFLKAAKEGGGSWPHGRPLLNSPLVYFQLEAKLPEFSVSATRSQGSRTSGKWSGNLPSPCLPGTQAQNTGERETSRFPGRRSGARKFLEMRFFLIPRVPLIIPFLHK